MAAAPVLMAAPANEPGAKQRREPPVSTIEANPEVDDVPVPRKNDHEVTTARNAQVGNLAVRRLLPLRTRRSVGAWCFIDHYGPAGTAGRIRMNVPPPPHIGLPTVTGVLDGDVPPRDTRGPP